MDDLIGKESLDIDDLVPRVFPSQDAAGSAVCGAIKLMSDIVNDSGDVCKDGKMEVVANCITHRKEEVRNGLDNLMTCHSVNPPFLTGYDWKLNYVFSSSKMSDMNEPLVKLDMKCSDGRVESVEMNSDDIKQLLTNLKQARESLD